MNRTRTKQVIFRVSEAELKQIKRKIEEAGTTQQKYIIQSLIGQKVTNYDGLKKIVPELKRIGNNLNQIARTLNSKGTYDDQMINARLSENKILVAVVFATFFMIAAAILVLGLRLLWWCLLSHDRILIPLILLLPAIWFCDYIHSIVSVNVMWIWLATSFFTCAYAAYKES